MSVMLLGNEYAEILRSTNDQPVGGNFMIYSQFV